MKKSTFFSVAVKFTGTKPGREKEVGELIYRGYCITRYQVRKTPKGKWFETTFLVNDKYKPFKARTLSGLVERVENHLHEKE